MKDKLGMVVVLLLVLLAWAVAGFALAVPYVWLGGWDPEYLTGVSFCAPPVAAVLGMLVWARVHMWRRGMSGLGANILTGLVAFIAFDVSLPIILRGASHALECAGWSKTAEVVYHARFQMVFGFPAMLFIVLMSFALAIGCVQALFSKGQDAANPPAPPSDPPYGGLGPDNTSSADVTRDDSPSMRVMLA